MEIGISTASLFMRQYNEDAVQTINGLGVGTCEVFLETFREYRREYGELLNDPKAKIAALNRMEELLLGEVAFIPLMQNDNSVIYNERIWLPTEEFLTGVGYGWQQSTIENPAN